MRFGELKEPSKASFKCVLLAVSKSLQWPKGLAILEQMEEAPVEAWNTVPVAASGPILLLLNGIS